MGIVVLKQARLVILLILLMLLILILPTVVEDMFASDDPLHSKTYLCPFLTFAFFPSGTVPRVLQYKVRSNTKWCLYSYQVTGSRYLNLLPVNSVQIGMSSGEQYYSRISVSFLKMIPLL